MATKTVVRWASVAGTAACLSTLVTVGAPTASAEPPSCWAMSQPTFSYAVPAVRVDEPAPGSVDIANACPSPVTVYLEAGRVATDGAGQMAFAAGPTGDIDFRLDATTATVKPGSSTKVTFTAIPRPPAKPGDHPLAVAVADRPDEPPVRWEPLPLRVAGDATALVEIHDITPHFHEDLNAFRAGSATIAYSITNSGAITVQGRPLAGLKGLYERRADPDFGAAPTITLVPGATHRGEVHIDRVWPAVRFDAEVGFIPSWVGGTTVKFEKPVVLSSAPMWAPPYPQMAVAIGIGCALLAVALTRNRVLRRRVRETSEEHGNPAAALSD